jgi:MarR family transcriptional regulator, organic hydroperoxide resistance regulator
MVYESRRSRMGSMKLNGEKDQGLIRRFDWEIAAISQQLDKLRHFWARTLGISLPQWRIIAALADTDRGTGVPVNAVSKMLHVDPSFVTTQSKLLEKSGLIHRKSSRDDARVVNMSLTEKTREHLAHLASQQGRVDDFIFAEFDTGELEVLTSKLAFLKGKLERACLKVNADLAV